MVYLIRKTLDAYTGLINYKSFAVSEWIVISGIDLEINHEGCLPLSAVKQACDSCKLTYAGSELKRITNSFIAGLKKKCLEVKLTEAHFSDVTVKQVPFFKDIAVFTDNKYVKGKIAIRVTGPHRNQTIVPLLDFELDGTAKCEKKLFGKYTGLPTHEDVEKIVKTIEKQSFKL